MYLIYKDTLIKFIISFYIKCRIKLEPLSNVIEKANNINNINTNFLETKRKTYIRAIYQMNIASAYYKYIMLYKRRVLTLNRYMKLHIFIKYNDKVYRNDNS